MKYPYLDNGRLRATYGCKSQSPWARAWAAAA